MRLRDSILCLLLSVAMVPLGPEIALAEDPPPAGTELTFEICGEIAEIDPAHLAAGLWSKRVRGSVSLVQRDPDALGPPVVWDCVAPNEVCGEFTVDLNGLAPISGAVTEISQDEWIYQLTAYAAGFVAGGGGVAQLSFFGTDVLKPNNPLNIAPDYIPAFSISGTLSLDIWFPGLCDGGGPCEGVEPIRANLALLSNGCPRYVPATSTWGLVTLVSLMLAGGVFAARR
jgi:hypothetical protein